MKFRFTPRIGFLVFPMLLSFAFLMSGCGAPNLTSLNQASGPERTLVMVNGDTGFSRIIWDAGLPSERAIPGGFLGGYMFSVPPGATVGNHPVALERGSSRSATVDFNVTAAQPFTAPRIDYVNLRGATFDSGNVSPLLVVQGANFDVGSVIQIGGTDIASVAYNGLRNDLYGVAPTNLGFPIYHYVSVLGIPDPIAAGSTINVTVRNLDGQVSAAYSYKLPANAASLDSDGDRLLDSWETGGFDANGDGTVDIDLPGLGASPFRRDLFLEVDVMAGLANPPIATTPGNPGTFDATRNLFASAPILNIGVANGINLVIDSSGTVPASNTVDLTAADNAMTGNANFYTLKAANFDNANRGTIYHYGIWANAMPGGFSGISDVSFAAFDGNGVATSQGDDFIVSFDDFSAAAQTLRSQVETLAHEFGHNLGQQHGGNNHNQFKPNYWSVMAYTWQLRTAQSNATRRMRVTCPPFYYATNGATEPNGALPAVIPVIVDYSEGMAITLVENTNTVDETTGVCGQAVDWNDDGDQLDDNINANVNDAGTSTETVTDFPNWRALNYAGPVSNGSSGT